MSRIPHESHIFCVVPCYFLNKERNGERVDERTCGKNLQRHKLNNEIST